MKKTETKKVETVKGGKILSGKVVSDKMKDTCVVQVESYTKHPLYEKFVRSSSKFKVDDKGNTAKIGDMVEIIECRPISKDKRFKLLVK